MACGSAQDLVQGFFVHLFEQNTLSGADQEKGRLRTFLLGSMQNFLLKQRERMSALKRGGAHQMVSFDQELPEAEAAMLATSHLSDVNSYDVAWASGVVMADDSQPFCQELNLEEQCAAARDSCLESGLCAPKTRH